MLESPGCSQPIRPGRGQGRACPRGRAADIAPETAANKPARRRIGRADPEPPVWGEAILRTLEGLFLRLDRAIHGLIPERNNPLAQTGAVANTTFVAAAATGILLLLWYSPSERLAYGSVEGMAGSPWTAQLARSLHRYSSDACIFFALLHGARLFVARRWGGPRWLAWVSGLFVLGILWLIGWLGYWLVWDQRAKLVALNTSKLLDALPLFSEPLSRSFLTPDSVNSLMFFVVFFAHMILPLPMIAGLWIHVTRLRRPRLLAGKELTLWVLGTLVLISFCFPAASSGPASMLDDSARAITMDWWYLFPIAFAERLSGGAAWAALLIGGAITASVPWWMIRGRPRPGGVDAERCDGCGLPGAAGRADAPGTAGRAGALRTLLGAAMATTLVLLLGGITVLPSDLRYASAGSGGPEMVVSFKLFGARVEDAPAGAKDDSARPPHMRGGAAGSRMRVPVRLRVSLDGVIVAERSYGPTGLFGDGASVAVERLPVSPGEHSVLVEIGDTRDRAQWPHRDERTLQFSPHGRHVLSLDRSAGFRWY